MTRCYKCGKEIHNLRTMKDYVYKTTIKGIVKYFCGYNCYKEFEKIKDGKKDKKEKARLLNKYNGVLTLKECELLEEVALLTDINIDSRKIKTRKDFEDLLIKHKSKFSEILGI